MSGIISFIYIHTHIYVYIYIYMHVFMPYSYILCICIFINIICCRVTLCTVGSSCPIAFLWPAGTGLRPISWLSGVLVGVNVFLPNIIDAAWMSKAVSGVNDGLPLVNHD